MKYNIKSNASIDTGRGPEQYSLDLNCPATSNARTTFFAKDVDSNSKQQKFRRFWRLQHGRGHTYEDWNNRIRQEDVFTYRRSRAIVSQLDVSRTIYETVATWVLTENLNGFSRHYAGLDGATIGFAALLEYDTKEDALSSHLVDRSGEMLGIDGEKLIEYVWREYGE